MKVDENGRKTIMMIFLGVFSLVVMGIFVYLIPTYKSDIIASQLIGLTLSALILMHFGFNGVPTELSIVWEKFKLILRPDRAHFSNLESSKGKPFFGVDPTKAKMSTEARAIKDQANEIVKQGKTDENLRKALDVIEANYETVKDYWVILLNKVRILRYLGQSPKAKKYLEQVKETFMKNQDFMNNLSESQAFLSGCCEIEAWFYELKLDYKISDLTVLAEDPNFKKQKILLKKGLNYFAENHAILMSLFFVAVIQQKKKEAIEYLSKAISINPQLAFDTVKDVENQIPHLLNLAKSLDTEIEEALKELFENNKPKKLFLTLVRGTTWITSILLMIAIAFTILQFKNYNPFTFNNLFEIERIIADSGGTNLGKATSLVKTDSGGTNLGKAIVFFNVVKAKINLINLSESVEIEICGTNLGNSTLKGKLGTNLGQIKRSKSTKSLGTNLG